MASKARVDATKPAERPAVRRTPAQSSAPAQAPAAPHVSGDTRGSIATAVAADLARLTPRLDRPDTSLMALALTLAQTLDDGAGMATAAVARELRATLTALTPEEHHDDDGFAALIEQLRAPVGDSANS